MTPMLIAVATLWCPIQQTPLKATEDAVLGKYEDAEAVRSLQTVFRQPGNEEARKSLAARYQMLRYGAASAFFLGTVNFITSGKEPPRVVHLPDPWPCPFNEQELHSRQRANVIGKTFVEGPGKVAEEAAAKEMKAHGVTCDLLAEWSRASLYDDLLLVGPPPNVARAELAVRLLLTLAAKNVYPYGLEGSAAVYDFLSGYFSLRRDYISAYVASLRARECFEKDGLSGSLDSKSFREKLVSEMEMRRHLAEQQRAQQGP